MKSNRHIVLAAANSDSDYRDSTLHLCDSSFRNDREIVKAALTNSKNKWIFESYVSFELKNDEAFIREMMTVNKYALSCSSWRVREEIDPEVKNNYKGHGFSWSSGFNFFDFFNFGQLDYQEHIDHLNSCIGDLINYRKENERIASANKELNQIAESIIANRQQPEKILNFQEGEQVEAPFLKKKYHKISVQTSPNSARNNQNPDKEKFATYLQKCIDATNQLLLKNIKLKVNFFKNFSKQQYGPCA